MRTAAIAAALGSLIALAAGPPAQARFYRGLRGPRAATPVRAAERYLARRAANIGAAGARLEVVATRRWQDHTIVRFAQRYEGLPVFERGVLLRVGPRRRVRAAVVFTAPGLQVIPQPIVPAAEAALTALARWGVARLGRLRARLGVLPIAGASTGALAWRVDGLTARGAVRTYVDAHTGEVRLSYRRAQSAQGTVYPTNPVTSPNLAIHELPRLDPPGDQLAGRAGTVFRHVSGPADDWDNIVIDQLATPDGSDFHFTPSEPDTDDPFSEVNAYFHLDRVDSYFRDVHGFAPARRMTVLVNYTEDGLPYDNAFSSDFGPDDALLVFGQGVASDYAYDGDVMYHEYGHFLIDEVAQLQYHPLLGDALGGNISPQAIHEGLADYWSATLAGDSRVAEYALAGWARDLTNTKRCPADLIGQAHSDGEIVGGAAWDIRGIVGASRADAIVFGGLSMIAPSATLHELAQAFLDAAATLVAAGRLTAAERLQIEAALRLRGMLACDRVLPLDDGPVTMRQFGWGIVDDSGIVSCADMQDLEVDLPGFFQYRVSVPADADRLTLRVTFSEGDFPRYKVYVRRGQPVGFAIQDVLGLDLAVAQTYDHAFTDANEVFSDLPIDLGSSPPLVPGLDYYVAVTRSHCLQTRLEVSAQIHRVAPPVDAGIDAAVGADGGPRAWPDGPGPDHKPSCGCRGAGPGSGSAPSGLIVVLLVAAAWRRRRNRRRGAPRALAPGGRNGGTRTRRRVHVESKRPPKENVRRARSTTAWVCRVQSPGRSARVGRASIARRSGVV